MITRILNNISAAISNRFATVEMNFSPIGTEALSGSAIREMMKSRNVTAGQLAAKLGIRRGQVHMMRATGTTAGLESLKIRTVLGFTD